LAEEARKAQEEAETKRILDELKAKEEEAQKKSLETTQQPNSDQTPSAPSTP